MLSSWGTLLEIRITKPQHSSSLYISTHTGSILKHQHTRKKSKTMAFKVALKARELKGASSKLVSQLTAISVKVMNMLLPSVQAQSK